MADLSRGYRFWLVRRLSMLIPACGSAGLLFIHEFSRMAESNSLLWIHFACLCMALFILAFTGWLTFRCVDCYLSHRNAGYILRRRTRRELAQAGLMGLVCFSVLPALSLLPATFQDISTSLPSRLLEVSRLLKVHPQPPLKQEKPIPVPVENVARTAQMVTKPAPPVPIEKAKEITSLPTRSLAVETQPAYVYSFQEEEEKADPWTFAEPPKMERLGLPDSLKPLEWMLPELNFEFLLLNNTRGTLTAEDSTTQSLDGDLDMSSAGFLLDFDLPVTRDNSLQFLYQPIGLSDAMDGNLDNFLLWQRFGFLFSHRLVGYTSESKIDLAFMAGLVGDNLLDTAGDGIISEGIRLSPCLGIELGLWQHGPAGVLVNFSQSFPTNITGTSARVTQVSALFRLDLTRNLSIQMGFFGIQGQFKAYSGKMTRSGSREEMEVLLRGPTFGLDFRF